MKTSIMANCFSHMQYAIFKIKYVRIIDMRWRELPDVSRKQEASANNISSAIIAYAVRTRMWPAAIGRNFFLG